MDKDNLICIGIVNKISTKMGKLVIHTSFYDKNISLNYIPKFIFIDNQFNLVPYLVEDIEVNIKTIDIEIKGVNKTDAYEFRKKQVFLPADSIKIEENKVDFLDYLVYNDAKEYLGKVTEADDLGTITLLWVNNNEKNFPIPLNQISHINHKNKSMYVSLPDDFVETFSS